MNWKSELGKGVYKKWLFLILILVQKIIKNRGWNIIEIYILSSFIACKENLTIENKFKKIEEK